MGRPAAGSERESDGKATTQPNRPKRLAPRVAVAIPLNSAGHPSTGADQQSALQLSETLGLPLRLQPPRSDKRRQSDDRAQDPRTDAHPIDEEPNLWLRVETASRNDLEDADDATTADDPADGLTVSLAMGRIPKDRTELVSLIGAKPLTLDLTQRDAASGQGRSLRQPLARALGLRKGEPWRPRVLDATAGLGQDAALMAGLGATLTLIERHPIVHALLSNAWTRALFKGQVLCADACAHLDQSAIAAHRPPHGDGESAPPEVIYLDPMFPTIRRAAPGKALTLLAWLLAEQPATDETELLNVARAAAQRRVVVKRPRTAPPLAGIEPQHRHQGAAVRYDVYPAIAKNSR